MSRWSQLVGAVQKRVSCLPFGVAAAVKLREQCNSIIGLSLQYGIVPTSNGELWLIKQIAPKARCFIDVGANVGEWSALFSAHMEAEAIGFAFEPVPETAAVLRERLRSNGLSKIEVLECALGNVEGAVQMFTERECGETSSLFKGHSNAAATSKIVPIVTLNKFTAERAIGNVDMVKIDAEGCDFLVLQGMQDLLRSRAVKVIQFEYNSPWIAAGSTLKAAFSLLESYQYKVRVLAPDHLRIISAEQYGEYFRYTNFVAYCEGPYEALLDNYSVA